MHDVIAMLGLPFLACLILSAILGYIGIHVLKREIIFIDIALAQIVAVGNIVAHMVFGAQMGSLLCYTFALLLALLAAAFYSLVRKRIVRIPMEGIIGISYALAAAVALLLVGMGTGGHIHIQHILAGSILWTTWQDILWSSIVFAGVSLVFFLCRRPLAKISDNYKTAIRQEVNVAWWDFLFYTLVGIVITFGVRLAGVVLVFSFLIIPTTVSAMFSSNWRTRFLIAWFVGVAASLVGLLFAERFDFSVGPAVALFLGVAIISAGLSCVWHRKTVLTISALLTVAFVVFMVSTGGP